MAKENETAISKVVLEVDGENYTLEYNRAALKQMEANGFDLMEADKKVITSMDTMITGALWKNHPNLSKEEVEKVIDGIYSEYDAAKLFPILMEMYTAAIPDFTNAKGTEKKVFKIVR